MNKLPINFFQRPTLDVAQDLLGKILVRKIKRTGSRSTLLSGKIVETEGYIARVDEACHAYRGMTERNRVMFGEAGNAYVYFTYGNHFMLNVVTEKNGEAAAVLIRALEPIDGVRWMQEYRSVENEIQLANGPGKLTQALNITRAQNGISFQSEELYILNAPEILNKQIEVTTRVGISKSKELPWRFAIKCNQYVSKGKPSV